MQIIGSIEPIELLSHGEIPEKKAIVPKRQRPIKWIGFLPTWSDNLPMGNNIALIARDSAKMTH
tara:strand:- start:756 stop:947 length:192 start_codon:yes stop_codon:yes gene_type:complete